MPRKVSRKKKEKKSTKELVEQANQSIYSYYQMMQETAEAISTYIKPPPGMQAIMKQVRDMQMIHAQTITQAMKYVTLPSIEIRAALEEYRKSVLNLAEPFMEMQRRMQEMAEITKPVIIPQITMIPPRLDSATEKLLNYIGWLERELMREREKNKELLRIIEQGRKRLKEKPKYIE